MALQTNVEPKKPYTRCHIRPCCTIFVLVVTYELYVRQIVPLLKESCN